MPEHGAVAWTVIEDSEAGTSVIGVFTSLDAAREVVAAVAGDRLADIRIEGHGLDAGAPATVPWVVQLSRDGTHLDTRRFIGCSSCGDDDLQYARSSFIAGGGAMMSVVVFAATPGRAISEAREYRDRLEEQGLWADGPIPPRSLSLAALLAG